MFSHRQACASMAWLHYTGRGGTRYLTAGITDKEDDLTVVNGTEYLTAGNNNEVVGGCNVRRLRNIQWDQFIFYC